jgi:outer membrane receptor protein involved in Fe transport
LHLNYKATEDQNIRLSVYQGISRPNYTELVDYTAQGVNGGNQGNINLRHSIGTCFDARYEIYPEKEEVFTAGIFYKYIQRPIEDILGANNNYTPTNGPDCANYGFELVGIKYFGNFGISTNYTYTKSIINNSKIFYLPTDSINPSHRNETRPLVGQSPNIINGAFIYRDSKKGLKFQIVYTMQGENLKTISTDYGLDVYQKTFHDLGATFEQNITKKFYVYAKGSNLLNSKLEFHTKSGINVENISTSASYLIGLKYNF